LKACDNFVLYATASPCLTHVLLTVLCALQATNPAAAHSGLLDIPAHTVVLDVQAPYSSSDDILTAAVKQQVRSRLTSQEYEVGRVPA
jgi:hypothetical protein